MFEGLKLTVSELDNGVGSVTAGKRKQISLLSPEFEINMDTVTFEGIGKFACKEVPSLLSMTF